MCASRGARGNHEIIESASIEYLMRIIYLFNSLAPFTQRPSIWIARSRPKQGSVQQQRPRNIHFAGARLLATTMMEQWTGRRLTAAANIYFSY